jgi:hypothetical protein
VLILIDTSASMGMQAEPGGRTRLDEAKAKATDLVNSLPRGVQALVLPYGSRATVAAPFTRDRPRLRDAVGALEVQATGEDLRSALVLAASLVGSEPSPQIVIFSDSARLGPAEEEALGGTPLVIEPCGAAAPNFGWTAMNVQRRSPTTEAYDLFGQVMLHGEEAEEVTLRVEADGRLLDLRKLQLEPGVETPVVVEGLTLGGEPMVLARLSAERGTARRADAGQRGVGAGAALAAHPGAGLHAGKLLFVAGAVGDDGGRAGVHLARAGRAGSAVRYGNLRSSGARATACDAGAVYRAFAVARSRRQHDAARPDHSLGFRASRVAAGAVVDGNGFLGDTGDCAFGERGRWWSRATYPCCTGPGRGSGRASPGLRHLRVEPSTARGLSNFYPQLRRLADA